jgi:hypothetical protein
MEADKRAMLEEHLPYELSMLEAAFDFLVKKEFAPYHECLFLHNTSVECFWMHARNLLEFFRSKPGASTATPLDFTVTFAHEKVGRDIEDQINNAITHLQYGRKSQPLALNNGTMIHIKGVIDREVKKFQEALTTEAHKVWKLRAAPSKINVYDLPSATNATTSASNLLDFRKVGPNMPKS